MSPEQEFIRRLHLGKKKRKNKQELKGLLKRLTCQEWGVSGRAEKLRETVGIDSKVQHTQLNTRRIPGFVLGFGDRQMNEKQCHITVFWPLKY